MFAGLVAIMLLARYPGDGPQASASGRFVVANVDLDQKSAVRSHALFLTERGSSARKLLLQYPRNVEVAWAPDRDALAVESRVGTTQTTLAIFAIERGATFRKVDVGDALYSAFPNLRGELTSYLHVHLDLVRWRRDGTLECRLRASAGNEPDLSRRYLVGLDGRAKPL